MRGSKAVKAPDVAPLIRATVLQLRQIHFGIVDLAFDIPGDDLPADHLAALLVECQSRLSVKLPPAVQSLGHPMAECGIILAGDIGRPS